MVILDWLDTHNGAVMAVATVLNVLVAATYAFVTWRLWRVAKDQAQTSQQAWIEAHIQAEAAMAAARAANEQADLTRQMFEASHRPYLTIIAPDPTFLGDGRIRFIIHLENKGTVPGVVTGWHVGVRYRGCKLIEQEFPEPKITRVVFPGVPERMPLLEISAANAAPIRGSGDAVLVEASVTYRGVGTKTYSTLVVMELISVNEYTMWERRTIRLDQP